MPTDGTSAPPSLDIAGAVATIRFGRPRHHNRFEPEDITTLSGMLETIEARRDVRVLVIAASGPSFSAGFDIRALEIGVDYAVTFGRLCDRLEALRVPTIAAINGGVYGGATDFALACDIRIGVPATRLMMPPTRLGLEYFSGGLRRYVEQLGVATAKRLLLTADTIEAETLLRIGFLHDLVEPGALGDAVKFVAGLCAAGAPDAVAGLKRSLNAIARGGADSDDMDARFVASYGTANAREGRRAWLEKRKPIFAD